MIHKALALSVLSMAAALPQAWGQAPPSRLNCAPNGLAVNGLVSYCQLREAFLPPADSFAVDNVNGSVTVQTWDGPGILVRVKVQTAAASYYMAEALAGEVVVDTSAGKVVVKGPSTNSYQSWSAKIEIHVPPATGVTIDTVNGSITVRGVQGPVVAKTVNGSVSLSGVGGDVIGKVVNGSILIAVGGDHWAGQTLTANTVNGSIEIDVPADCSAHVTASVSMGTIKTNFPVQIPAASAWFGQKVSFDVGGAGSSNSAIRMAATLGSIQLRQE